MRRLAATVFVCWFGYCSAGGSNIAPLAFGMSPDQVAAALGAPLVYVSGRPGAEVYYATRSAGVPGLNPVQEAIVLQFRRGGLTGWKSDWRQKKFWLF